MNEEKVKTAEFMSIDDCKKLVAKGNHCFDWQDALKYHQHKVIDEAIVMYASQFMSKIADDQSRLTSLESELEQLKAENSKMKEALEEIIKTNWANGKYLGRSSAQLHLTATIIAEQALKGK